MLFTSIGTMRGRRSRPMRQRDANAVVELEPVRHRRLEALAHRFAHDVERERRVTGRRDAEAFHPRLWRAFVRLSHANADRRDVIEKEIRPMVGRDDDERVGPRGSDALPELGESALEPLLLVLRQRFPLAHEKRPVAGRVGADQASHRAACG